MEEIIVEWRYSNGVKRWMPAISRETCSLGVGKGQWVRTHPGFKSVCHCVSWGWDDWLFKEKRVQLVASEDGLMLNTGVMPWSQHSVTGVLSFCFWDSSAHLCYWVCPCVDPVPFLWKELSKWVEGYDWECGWGVLWLCWVIVYGVPRAFLPFFSEVQAFQTMSSLPFWRTSDDFYF